MGTRLHPYRRGIAFAHAAHKIVLNEAPIAADLGAGDSAGLDQGPHTVGVEAEQGRGLGDVEDAGHQAAPRERRACRKMADAGLDERISTACPSNGIPMCDELNCADDKALINIGKVQP